MLLLSSIYTVLSASSGIANQGGDRFGGSHVFGHSRNTTRLIADLTGTSGSGEVVYITNSSKGNLNAGISLPIDGNLLADSNAAATAKLTLQLTNASCTLEVTDMFFHYPKTSTTASVTETADYQVGVRSHTTNSGTTVTGLLGSCQNTGSSNRNDLPTIKSGDTVNVLLNGISTPILTGTFK